MRIYRRGRLIKLHIRQPRCWTHLPGNNTTTAIYEAAGQVLNREFMNRQFGSPRSFMHQVRQTLPELPQAGRAWDGGKYVMGYTGVRLA